MENFLLLIIQLFIINVNIQFKTQKDSFLSEFELNIEVIQEGIVFEEEEEENDFLINEEENFLLSEEEIYEIFYNKEESDYLFNIEEDIYIFNKEEIERLAEQRWKLQKTSIDNELFNDFMSFFNFSDALIQKINYLNALKHIELIISFDFTDCFLGFGIKELFRKQFISFFYFPGINEFANDNEKLNLFRAKTKEFSKKAIDRIYYLQILYKIIDKNKNDPEELKKMLRPNLLKKFERECRNKPGTRFSKFIYDLTLDYFNFFIDKYKVITINNFTHPNCIMNIQTKLFEVIKNEKFYDFLYIAIDTKNENVFLRKEHKDLQSKMVEIYDKSINEKQALASNYDFIIFNLSCMMLIKDSDFEIYFADKRYYEKVVLLTQKSASEVGHEFSPQTFYTDEFETLIFQKLFETLFPKFLETSRSLQIFSEKLKMPELIIEYFYQHE